MPVARQLDVFHGGGYERVGPVGQGAGLGLDGVLEEPVDEDRAFTHSFPLMRYSLAGDWKFWESYDRAHLEACTALAVLMLDGWKESVGVQAELAIAAELELPVIPIVPASVGIRAESAPAAGTGVRVEVM